GYFTISEGKNPPLYFIPKAALPQFTSTPKEEGNYLRLLFKSRPGLEIRLQASFDLITWTPRETLLPHEGENEWMVSFERNTPKQFFRLGSD
ncbi:MAG TPA: hypothetical protein VM260_17090, partial [Pirellula sp.]|nr:hypothetical protein [Pirellula sp.]